jgi:pilus assembly protein Flp/PilA
MIEKLQFMTIMLVNDIKAKRDERGATAVEYGLMVALIAVAIIVAVRTLGTTLSGLFDGVSGDIGGAGGTP